MLIELGGHDAEIWVQDFHLMLVARELRRAGHRGRLGFYLHVPFPALDVIETMPWATEIVAALLDYDRIGLQTQRWADNFIATARGLLGNEAEARARDRVARRSGRHRSGSIRRRGRRSGAANPNESMSLGLEAMLGGRKLILGVDRLDYSQRHPRAARSVRAPAREVPRVAQPGFVRPGLGADALRRPRVRRAARRASSRSSVASTARTAKPTGCPFATSTAPTIRTTLARLYR